jgi:myo-inositol-1(or 4)-monophosphatase
MMDAFVKAACDAADVSGAAIRPWFRAGLAADLKSDASPVTLADRTAELALRAVLGERFPDHSIEGEEFAAQNPGQRYRWVLDPIDGTRAFITGRPSFGTLIALLDDGVPVLGIMDQPIIGERWIGVAGRETVFQSRLGGRAGCRPCADLAQAELSCTSIEVFTDDLGRWQKLSRAARRTSFGGDCTAYGLLAIGHVDVIAEATMKLWDWAALVPIVQGAGGRVTDWQGQPMSEHGNGQILAVGDPRLLEPALALLAA